MSSYTSGTTFFDRNTKKRNWVLIDASKDHPSLGRLASRIALLLRGKDKATFTPNNINSGSNVVVINASHIKVTGKKMEQEKFFWHTGYPGGIKEKSWNDIVDGKYPERLLRKAVERMMPKESPLARSQMSNLYIYWGAEHDQVAQNPVEVNSLVKIKTYNEKNSTKSSNKK